MYIGPRKEDRTFVLISHFSIRNYRLHIILLIIFRSHLLLGLYIYNDLNFQFFNEPDHHPFYNSYSDFMKMRSLSDVGSVYKNAFQHQTASDDERIFIKSEY